VRSSWETLSVTLLRTACCRGSALAAAVSLARLETERLLLGGRGASTALKLARRLGGRWATGGHTAGTVTGVGDVKLEARRTIRPVGGSILAAGYHSACGWVASTSELGDCCSQAAQSQ
jgi:hypothetical protein